MEGLTFRERSGHPRPSAKQTRRLRRTRLAARQAEAAPEADFELRAEGDLVSAGRHFQTFAGLSRYSSSDALTPSADVRGRCTTVRSYPAFNAFPRARFSISGDRTK